MLAVTRQVLEMREEDGPQRNSFKGQVAAYALLEGPRLPRDLLADLLEVSGPTINHYADATKSRMRTRDRASALIGRLHGRVCCGILWGNRAGGAFVDLVDEGLGHQFRNVRRDYRIRIEIARTYTRNAWLEHGPGWVVVLGSVVESSGVVVLQTSQALAPAASCMLTISPSSRRSP